MLYSILVAVLAELIVIAITHKKTLKFIRKQFQREKPLQLKELKRLNR
jgi:hypothetical protein